MSNSYFFTDSRETIDKVFKNVRNGNKGSYPSQLGKYAISSIRDITLGIDTAEP
jgi:phosphoglucomutase/phosphoglucomutase/phosphopentomutase